MSAIRFEKHTERLINLTSKGFESIGKRGVVERIFSWFDNHGRLAAISMLLIELYRL